MLKYGLIFVAGFIVGNLWFAFMEYVANKFQIVIKIGEEKDGDEAGRSKV